MPPPKCTLNLLTSHMSPQCVTDYSPVSAGHLGVTSPFSSTFSSSPWTSLQGFSTDWPVKEPGSPTIKLVPKTYEGYPTTKNCSPATSPPHWYQWLQRHSWGFFLFLRCMIVSFSPLSSNMATKNISRAKQLTIEFRRQRFYFWAPTVTWKWPFFFSILTRFSSKIDVGWSNINIPPINNFLSLLNSMHLNPIADPILFSYLAMTLTKCPT